MSGLLCAKKINVRIKEKLYRTVVRPAIMYEVEAWPVKKRTRRGDFMWYLLR